MTGIDRPLAIESGEQQNGIPVQRLKRTKSARLINSRTSGVIRRYIQPEVVSGSNVVLENFQPLRRLTGLHLI